MVRGFRGEEKEKKGEMEQFGETGRREGKKMWAHEVKEMDEKQKKEEKKENETKWEMKYHCGSRTRSS